MHITSNTEADFEFCNLFTVLRTELKLWPKISRPITGKSKPKPIHCKFKFDAKLTITLYCLQKGDESLTYTLALAYTLPNRQTARWYRCTRSSEDHCPWKQARGGVGQTIYYPQSNPMASWVHYLQKRMAIHSTNFKDVLVLIPEIQVKTVTPRNTGKTYSILPLYSQLFACSVQYNLFRLWMELDYHMTSHAFSHRHHRI